MNYQENTPEEVDFSDLTYKIDQISKTLVALREEIKNQGNFTNELKTLLRFNVNSFVDGKTSVPSLRKDGTQMISFEEYLKKYDKQ